MQTKIWFRFIFKDQRDNAVKEPTVTFLNIILICVQIKQSMKIQKIQIIYALRIPRTFVQKIPARMYLMNKFEKKMGNRGSKKKRNYGINFCETRFWKPRAFFNGLRIFNNMFCFFNKITKANICGQSSNIFMCLISVIPKNNLVKPIIMNPS